MLLSSDYRVVCASSEDELKIYCKWQRLYDIQKDERVWATDVGDKKSYSLLTSFFELPQIEAGETILLQELSQYLGYRIYFWPSGGGVYLTMNPSKEEDLPSVIDLNPLYHKKIDEYVDKYGQFDWRPNEMIPEDLI